MENKQIVQWTYPDAKNPGDAIAFNKNENDEKVFYEVEVGKYGQPIIVQEPDLAFELPENTGDGKQKIAGIVTDDGQRFSLSNAKAKGISLQWYKDEMVLEINRKAYYLHFIYEPDKNRIMNYVGFFSKNRKDKEDEVKVYEMADVLENFFMIP